MSAVSREQAVSDQERRQRLEKLRMAQVILGANLVGKWVRFKRGPPATFFVTCAEEDGFVSLRDHYGTVSPQLLEVVDESELSPTDRGGHHNA